MVSIAPLHLTYLFLASLRRLFSTLFFFWFRIYVLRRRRLTALAVFCILHNLANDIHAGQDFPPSFPSTVKHIYRQLLRVFAHIYHAHYAQILHLRSEPHFNSLFAHFLAFGSEFELLEMKDLRGSSSAPVGVGSLWERWKGMGIIGG